MKNMWKQTVALAMAGFALSVIPHVVAAGEPQGSSSALRAPAVVGQQLAQAATPDHAVPTAPAGQGTHETAPAAAHPASGAHAPAAAGEHGPLEHAPGEPASEHHGGFPPFDSTTFLSQFVWLALSFGLLYFLMSKVTLPRIGRILEERHDRIADDLEEAMKHRTESEAAQAAYEKSLSEARNKAHTIAGETRAKLSADAEANRKSLEAELAEKLASAEQRIATTKTEALTHVRGIAVDTAHTIVSTLIGSAPAQTDVERAVDGVLASKDAA